MSVRSIIDPPPPWKSPLPPAPPKAGSRPSSKASKPKLTGKRSKKNGSQLQIQTSSAQANPQSTTSLASNGSMATTTTATYSDGTTLRRYNITRTHTHGGGITLPSQQLDLDTSPPLLALSLYPSSTPPSLPIDAFHSHPDHNHGPCPHGCDRSETPITSVSFPVSNPRTNPVVEPVFPSDPILDRITTNATSTNSGSRRSSHFSKEWRHDPKRNKKAQEAAGRIIEGCYSRKERGRMWRMRDRVRRWRREFMLKGPRDGGGRVKGGYDAGGGSGGGAGRRGRGEAGAAKGEGGMRRREGGEARRKGVQDADNGGDGKRTDRKPEEKRWQQQRTFGTGDEDDGMAIPAPPPIPKPPRNSVVMERLAEVLGDSSTETSFGFRRRDYLRQAEETSKDTNNKNRGYHADYNAAREEVHEKTRSKSKNRVSGTGIWKRGLEKVKKLLVLSEKSSRKTRSASRPATPRIAARTKIVDTSLLHPHWRARPHLGKGEGGSEDGHPSFHKRPNRFPQVAAMEMPETTNAKVGRNNNNKNMADDGSDESSMVAPPRYFYMDENTGEPHFGEGEVPKSAKEKGKGKAIDYSLVHEDSPLKIQVPGYPPPLPGPKDKCICKHCQTAMDLGAMATASVDQNGYLPTYRSLADVDSALANSRAMPPPLFPSQTPASHQHTRSNSSRPPITSSSQTLPADRFESRPLPLLPSSQGSTWGLPRIQPSADFGQAPELTRYTVNVETRHLLPGRLHGESALRHTLTPEWQPCGSKTPPPSHLSEEEARRWRFVTYHPNENKHYDDGGDFVVEEEEEDPWLGSGEPWDDEYEFYEREEYEDFNDPQLGFDSDENPSDDDGDGGDNDERTDTDKSTDENTDERSDKNADRDTDKSTDENTDRDTKETAPEADSTTENNSAAEVVGKVPSNPRKRRRSSSSSDSEPNQKQHEHVQYDENDYDPCDQRAPSYVGIGQRPPSKLFFTRPRPRALSSSSATNASASASVSAALPSPVPEEGGGSNIADAEEHDPQKHDNQGDLGNNMNSKQHRHSHHSHHSHHHNRYSKSSSNTNTNSNSNDHRWSRSSWSLSISIISTRASSPHSFGNSKRESKRDSKRNSSNSNSKRNSSSNNRHSTGISHSTPHSHAAEPSSSSWYKTTAKVSKATNRKRSSTTSTTGTTATGSSRVSELDKVTSNDSSSSSSSSSSFRTHAHAHSRTHSGQTTGVVDVDGVDGGGSGRGSEHESSTLQLEEEEAGGGGEGGSGGGGSGGSGTEDGRNGPRHARTASVTVESDLFIIPLEEVEDYVLPPDDDESPKESGDRQTGDGGGRGEGERRGKRGVGGRDEEEEEEGIRQAQWEWEREWERRNGTGYGRGDAGGRGGGWRIVDGGNGRVRERAAGGGRVNIKVGEMKGEGTEKETTGTGESDATSTGTGLWMKDSRGTLGTLGTRRSE
ncbi:hypothetical protein QBC32DRAFT_386049 [Pseudoneurospora amorphoporcata]|uniref:Uncharacterized protein n=1 Tax=Pseudoneurospora amorphoporcata TaxID=241081 RepID=A0AAN6NZF4_9PEZI|nr:hypothetical protein QBC32DRAFT_386049 [Pseudoneurospora amorphoporcata]